jgi:uncharacterized protein DUF4375/HEAT repeat protein
MKRARREGPGFLDYVTNPHLWFDAVAGHNRGDKAAGAAKGWSNQKIVREVRRLVLNVKTGQDARGVARALKSLGRQTHPVLLELLADPSLRCKLVKPTGRDILPEAPFNRLCDLLEDDPPESAVPLLAQFLEERSSEIRKHAALVIGAVGTQSIVDPVRKALRDSDHYVRSYALMGLQRSLKAERTTAACRRELFDDIQRLLVEGENADDAAKLLLEFDQGRAVAFFLSDAVFTPESAALHEILKAMRQLELAVPHNQLLVLIEKLSSKDLKFPQTYQLGEALQSLGRHRFAEDKMMIEKWLSHGEEVIAEGASGGLLALHGLDGFRERLWNTMEKRGTDGLSVPQHHYYTVFILDAEVKNGGFKQYFFNSSGDNWRVALQGLEEMGFRERLAVFREVLSRFGKDGPSEHRGQRMHRLAKLVKEKETIFSDLETRYYGSSEVIDVFATQYVLKNYGAFR